MIVGRGRFLAVAAAVLAACATAPQSLAASAGQI
jgi:hypothetical protein